MSVDEPCILFYRRVKSSYDLFVMSFGTGVDHEAWKRDGQCTLVVYLLLSTSDMRTVDHVDR